MPALKMGGPKKAAARLMIKNTDFMKGLFGNQVDPELAEGGGASMPVMRAVETAAPPAKAGAKTGRSGGMFGGF